MMTWALAYLIKVSFSLSYCHSNESHSHLCEFDIRLLINYL